jgi:uncharacterized protein YdeI (BOF family)
MASKRTTWFSALIGLLLLTACRKQPETILGLAPVGQAQTILGVKSGDTRLQVTISGEIIEKCPVAGCWFRLRDNTGVIKVDTKSAGFVVVKVPLKTHVTVAGRIGADGEEKIIEATGLRY